MPNGIDVEAVRTAVRFEMAKQGMSSAKLAEVTSIPKSTVDNFLDSTTASPAFDRVCAFVKALGLSLDELLGLRTPVHQELIFVPTDVTAIKEAHQKTIEAKDAHIAEIRGEIDRLRASNARLNRWHQIFIAENVFLVCLTTLEFFVRTCGCFRDFIADQISGRIMHR